MYVNKYKTEIVCVCVYVCVLRERQIDRSWITIKVFFFLTEKYGNMYICILIV